MTTPYVKAPALQQAIVASRFLTRIWHMDLCSLRLRAGSTIVTFSLFSTAPQASHACERLRPYQGCSPVLRPL